MFRNFVVIMFACSLMLVAGCEDQEKIDLQNNLNAKNETIQDLQMGLESRGATISTLRTDLQIQGQVIDSLKRASLDKDKALASAESNLTKEQKRSESLNAVIDQLKPANVLLPLCQDSLAEEVAARTHAEAECENLQAVVAERDALISQIKPWYSMYRYNATERNWFEKLCGADKQKQPAVPEPQF